jgi:hypothetical protein
MTGAEVDCDAGSEVGTLRVPTWNALLTTEVLSETGFEVFPVGVIVAARDCVVGLAAGVRRGVVDGAIGLTSLTTTGCCQSLD